jgi:hypothetical protein
VFDGYRARDLLNQALDGIMKEYPETTDACVVGGADVGIWAIAYSVSRERSRNDEARTWRTVSCENDSKDEDALDNDEPLLTECKQAQTGVASLEPIDVIVRVGGDEQLKAEVEQFKYTHRNTGKRIAYEYEIPEVSTNYLAR